MKDLTFSKTLERYATKTDEEIVALAKDGEDFAIEYILSKYKSFVKLKAHSYFLIGADHEDLIQEGMIGLFKAIRGFDGENFFSFKNFAELCIKRQIITAIKNATRQKHIPLNSYVSLNKPVFCEGNERPLIDMLSSICIDDPEELIIGQESRRYTEKKFYEILSKYEFIVLTSYLQGNSYHEIAVELGKPIKSIDNALQRIKKKIADYMENERKSAEM